MGYVSKSWPNIAVIMTLLIWPVAANTEFAPHIAERLDERGGCMEVGALVESAESIEDPLVRARLFNQWILIASDADSKLAITKAINAYHDGLTSEEIYRECFLDAFNSN